LFFIVMPGLVPGIHVFSVLTSRVVDGPNKSGHDEKRKRLGGRVVTRVAV
jgi:hypothetical protein